MDELKKSCICGHSEDTHDDDGCFETYGKFSHLTCTCGKFSEWAVTGIHHGKRHAGNPT